MNSDAERHATSAQTERVLAALHIVMIVAYADEEFSEEERRMLEAQVKAFSSPSVDEQRIRAFLESLPTRLESKAWAKGAYATVAESLVEPDSRREAFAMALEIAQADGKIDLRETQALLEVAEKLQIDSAFARARMKRVRETRPEKLPDLDKTPWQESAPAGPRK
jgi:tellurite resistance protein